MTIYCDHLDPCEDTAEISGREARRLIEAHSLDANDFWQDHAATNWTGTEGTAMACLRGPVTRGMVYAWLGY